MSDVFAYGTLQLPEVMFAVTGRNFKGRTARLENYLRQRLRGKCYPGIRPYPGGVVFGICFSGLGLQDLRKLDHFEGGHYRREKQKVIVLAGDEREAETYVLREEFYGLLLAEDWILEEFRQRHMIDFLANPD